MNAAFLGALGLKSIATLQGHRQGRIGVEPSALGRSRHFSLVMVSASAQSRFLHADLHRFDDFRRGRSDGTTACYSRWLAWRPRLRSPVTSLLVQLSITLLMCLRRRTARGRHTVDARSSSVSLALAPSGSSTRRLRHAAQLRAPVSRRFSRSRPVAPSACADWSRCPHHARCGTTLPTDSAHVLRNLRLRVYASMATPEGSRSSVVCHSPSVYPSISRFQATNARRSAQSPRWRSAAGK